MTVNATCRATVIFRSSRREQNEARRLRMFASSVWVTLAFASGGRGQEYRGEEQRAETRGAASQMAIRPVPPEIARRAADAARVAATIGEKLDRTAGTDRSQAAGSERGCAASGDSPAFCVFAGAESIAAARGAGWADGRGCHRDDGDGAGRAGRRARIAGADAANAGGDQREAGYAATSRRDAASHGTDAGRRKECNVQDGVLPVASVKTGG